MKNEAGSDGDGGDDINAQDSGGEDMVMWRM